MAETIGQNPRKVLIVEDSKIWQKLLPRLFDRKGIETVVVTSAEAAKEALKKGGFSEIVTDGLEGDWKIVADNAGGLPVKLLSLGVTHKSAAEEQGIRFFDKNDFNPEDLVQQTPNAL